MKLFRIVLLTTIFLLLILPLTPVLAEGPIDIGSAAIDRDSEWGNGPRTIISGYNPADYTGKLTQVQILTTSNMTGFWVGTYYLVSGSTYKCRDSQSLGTIAVGAVRTYSVDLDVVAGDLIGYYFKGGTIEYTSSIAGRNTYYLVSEAKDAGDSGSFSTNNNTEVSIYGTGLRPIERQDYTGLNPIRSIGPAIILLGFILTCGFFAIMALKSNNKIEISVTLLVVLMLIGIALLVGMPVLIQGFDAIMWGW